MNVRQVVLIAIVATVTLAPAAATEPGAAKQRVAISVAILPTGKATLTPYRDGALARDSGTFGGAWSRTPDRTVIRDGQTIYIHSGTWTLTGKLGTLVLRERNEWVDAGGSPDAPPWIGTGSWKVVRGTGQYAGITGGGRSGHAGLGSRWLARYEGFLTAR
jgi:hypothetical protein